MTIFDYLQDILVTKKGDLQLEDYVPFLVNRWLSFINPVVCEGINQLNSKNLLENKQLHYKTALRMFPKMKHTPKIKYIKKITESEQDKAKTLQIIAQNFEIYEREDLLLLGS